MPIRFSGTDFRGMIVFVSDACNCLKSSTFDTETARGRIQTPNRNSVKENKGVFPGS
jgi:hypothetical protein